MSGAPVEPDEFNVARPRWIIPVAVAGAVLLFVGLVVGTVIGRGGDTRPVQITGTTVTVAADATAPTTTLP